MTGLLATACGKSENPEVESQLPTSTPSPSPTFVQVRQVQPSEVNGSVTSVVVPWRPAAVKTTSSYNCPYSQSSLVSWNPGWISADGVVSIPVGTRVLIQGNDDIPVGTLIRELRIPATSEVVFADKPATFRIRDVRIEGAMRLGSPSCRLTSQIEFIFDTDEDVSNPSVRRQIFERAGLGIVVESGGVFDVFGKLHQPTWTRLAATANAGSARVELSEPVDWQPGQRIVLVTSELRDYPYTDQNEVRTITAVHSGTSLELDTPLGFSHYGGWEYQVEVGLLSRNIVFRTASRVLDAAPTFGGHVMAHAARISGAEFYGLGQQNFMGRYPLHLHHGGDVAGTSYLTDNSIWRSNWWCAVIHRTDRAIVSKNVAYDVFGHCYYIEDGVEQNNEVSFNLAARVKIMGPTDAASLAGINTYTQEGFVLLKSGDFANPADRAAAGFYISNGNNRIIGNAASGGFAGYLFPNLPQPLGSNPNMIVPMSMAISVFDGNTAHTAGYLWEKAGCVYAGGVLQTVNVAGQPTLQYQSGRPVYALNRQGVDIFANTKTFLCTVGITHWGNEPRVINMESWDNEQMAKLFGSASIESAIFAGQTGNTPNLQFNPLGGYRRGFQFYDTWTRTILRGVQFRDIRASAFPGPARSQNNCAFYTMVHSDQYTPQRMSTTAEVFYVNVEDNLRFCHDDTGTLSSRNFNLIDTDGTATARTGDGVPAGPRIVGSGYSSVWNVANDCVRHRDWGLWACPQRGAQNVASIATMPNLGVEVDVYDLGNGRILGQNPYSAVSEFADAQITAPSGLGWHHRFPGGIPDAFNVWALQVPQQSHVLLSFSLPVGVACSVPQTGWQSAASLQDLLATDAPVYTTERNTCFVRVPWTDIGSFNAAGLSIPYQAWYGFSSTTNFTVVTGCSNSNPACQGLVQAVPTLP